MTTELDLTESHPAVSLARPVVTVYLSGSIKKGSTDARPPGTFWSREDEQELVDGAGGVQLVRLNPARTVLRRQDYIANYGADLHLVAISDAIVVDARTEKGVGVGAEMMHAQSVGVPVIAVCPPNTNYRRDFIPDVFGEDLHDWVHPFIAGLSDYIVDDFRQAGALLATIARGTRLAKRTVSPQDAVAHYHRVRADWVMDQNATA